MTLLLTAPPKQVPGWPLWEFGVFSLLRRCFAAALVPMYVHYCRCLTHSCDSARRANSLGLEEWMCLVTDCNVRRAASEKPNPSTSRLFFSPTLLLAHALRTRPVASEPTGARARL